jgi:ABC-type multidrug transport system ATPase subunit
MKQNRPIALALRGVSKRLDRPAVEALDLAVYGGEFYVLVGPNGAGKTTTLRMAWDCCGRMPARSASKVSMRLPIRSPPSK